MWVRTVLKMTEHSGQQDPAETLRRALSEHANQIHSHDSSHQTNQQLEQTTSMLQQTLNTQSTTQVDGAAASPVTPQLPHSCDVIPLTQKNSLEWWVIVGHFYSNVH
ncbi:hypothetical protein ATANTOWER_030686 [Ataeniobius toweri]|uniref:Uncharacterized protein n=1 Tax=Ataeniobius toweri TaxID=208326 RepID=A0ABU7ARX6_9TELE|nr:hypothetical protein [Ataeniobius toweri]